MFASFVSRWPFLAAVALVSAAVSDVFVESIADTGVFGSAYFDTDDSSIVPSLFIALALAGYVIGLHLLALAKRSRGTRRDWLADAAREVAGHAPLRDFPAIVTMQFVALFAMETIERIVACGHAPAGLLWLGGPVVFSVLAHAGVGVLCTLGAGWLMRVSVAGFASLVCIALDFVLCALGPRGAAAFVVRRDAASCGHGQPARVRHISGRAPPPVLREAAAH